MNVLWCEKCKSIPEQRQRKDLVKMLEETGTKVSISTVKQVLYRHNLKGRSARKKPLLQNRHKKARLRFATAYGDKDHTFVPVSSSIFTRSFAVVLGLIYTFHNKVRSSLGDRMRLLPERYDGCLVPWCLYLCTIVCTDEHGTFRHLEISG
ncbi:unnamed protein product [Oncorhynchus mykiss]|uniref:Transposase Tc1-like domain-containing protein n=1 Tax=Oncorhynchus mykiss TaxID=8022 RepID=A0A060WPX5_ONCMY|nr:unnamed protein product [Oncorhynchus mykiss]